MRVVSIALCFSLAGFASLRKKENQNYLKLGDIITFNEGTQREKKETLSHRMSHKMYS